MCQLLYYYCFSVIHNLHSIVEVQQVEFPSVLFLATEKVIGGLTNVLSLQDNISFRLLFIHRLMPFFSLTK